MDKLRGASFGFSKSANEDREKVVRRTISTGFLSITGCVSSQRPRHFRISCAVPKDVLERGGKTLHGLVV